MGQQFHPGQIVLYECCLCEEQVNLGESAWDGRPVPQWGGLVVCKLCEVQLC